MQLLSLLPRYGRTLHVDLVAEGVAVLRVLRQRSADRPARIIEVCEREDLQVGLLLFEFIQKLLGRHN